jgi:tetratricopeptide (TPR) repeat protein
MSEAGEDARAFEEELRHAGELLAAGQLAEAQLAAAQALAQRPANVLAQNLLGLVLFEQGRCDRALEIFDSLVRRNPDIVTLRLNAGHAALCAAHHDRALEHFQRAVDLDPGHGRAFAYLALVHLQRREPHLAGAALEEAGLRDLADELGGPALEEWRLAELAGEIELRARALLPPLEGSPPPHEGFAEVRLRVEPAPPAPAEAPVAATALEAALAAAASGSAPTEGALEAPGPEDLAAALDAASLDAVEPTPEESFELEAELPDGEPAPELELPAGNAAPDAAPRPAPAAAETAAAEPPLEPATPWAELQTVQVMVDAVAARTRRGPAPSRPQGRAAERLASLALPGLYEGPAAALRAGLLVLRLGPTHLEEGEPEVEPAAEPASAALVRSDLVLVCRGRLSLRPARRVRKGAEQEPFLCEGVPLLLAEGEGSLVLHPGPGLEVELLELDDEGLYLRESALCACSSSLRWENGRIPGAGPSGPGIVQVRGTGFVALRRQGRLHTVAVLESEALSVRLDRLVGWTGKAVPQQIQSGGEGIETVGFTGEGMLLVSLL